MLIVSIFCCKTAQYYSSSWPWEPGDSDSSPAAFAPIDPTAAGSAEDNSMADDHTEEDSMAGDSAEEDSMVGDSAVADSAENDSAVGDPAAANSQVSDFTVEKSPSGDFPVAESPEEEEIETAAETAEEEPSIRLYMIDRFPSDNSESTPSASFAGILYSELLEKDENWVAQIYASRSVSPKTMAARLGRSQAAYNGFSDWTNVGLVFYDGDNRPISGYSNAREILAMASVYASCSHIDDFDTYRHYAEELWKRSHKYSLSMSNVYYCEGECQYADDEDSETEDFEKEAATDLTSEPLDAVTTTAEGPFAPGKGPLEPAGDGAKGIVEDPATPASAVPPTVSPIAGAETTASSPSLPEAKKESGIPACSGHVDLIIKATITGLSEKKNLCLLDTYSDSTDDYTEFWKGWSMLRKRYVQALMEQDWYDVYNLDVTTSQYIRNPLEESEIRYYMDMLPEDTSEERKKLVLEALRSVGTIPYYWGGKPYGPGYEENHFGSVVAADKNGRLLRGLDCSGWIAWVYWTALDICLPYESTGGLCAIGHSVKRADLKPGDFLVKTGKDSHTCMFLAWAADGSMYVIHERGSMTNNVIVSKYDLNWPYYRSLLD